MNKPASEMIALADEIEQSHGLARMTGDGLGAVQIGIKKTAQVVSALRTAANQSALHGKPDGAVRWTRVNDEPFEYAIQQGEHGDEFVKLLDGSCLRRAALLAAETGPGDVRTESSKQYRDAVDSVNRSTDREIADALAVKEACKRAVTELDCMYVNDERVPYGGIPADPESSVWREAIKAAEAAIDRLDVKAEAKSQEPEAVAWSCGTCGDIDVPEKFRVFGSCYRCAAQRSIDKRKRKIEQLKCEMAELRTHPTTNPEAPAVSVDAIRARFDAWFENNFFDPDGGSDHLPDWLKDDLRSTWNAALNGGL